MRAFRLHCLNFSRDEAYLKVPNHFCTVGLLENGRAAVFRPFPSIQHYLLLGCNPSSRVSAEWEWVINSGQAQHTNIAPVELSHPRPIDTSISTIVYSSSIFIQMERIGGRIRPLCPAGIATFPCQFDVIALSALQTCWRWCLQAACGVKLFLGTDVTYIFQ